MKKLIFLTFFLTGLLFAEQIKVRPGFSSFGTDNITEYAKPGKITEICPLGDVCRLSFEKGYVLYVKKSETYIWESYDYFLEYKVLSWDYNVLYCDMTEKNKE